MKTKTYLLIFLASFVLVTSPLFAYIEKSGDVSGETWTAETYYVSDNIWVNTNSSLTIQEGSVIKFQHGKSLKVYGTLDVNGANGNNVIFTSKDDDNNGEIIPGSDGNPYPGDWDGIKLDGYGVDNQGIGEFDWCLIRYGGKYLGYARTNVHFNYSTSGHFINSISEYANYSALKTTHCSPDINNSTFRNSNNHGVSCNTYSSTITQNTFSDNGDHGLYITGDCTPTITNNIFNNNDGYGAYLNNINITSLPGNTGIGNTYNGIALSGTIDTSFEFTNLIGFPYVIHGWLTVTTNNTLTIAEGTVMKFDSGDGLKVYGTLDVNGTSDNNVIFTSFRDDEYGGDTNGDSTATSPYPGDWDGINLYGPGVENQGIGEFDWCLIRYGGKYLGNARTNVHFNYSTSGHFINSISEYANYSALKTTHCSPDINNSTFRNSNNHGVSCNTYSSTITQNTFSDNGDHGLYITGDCTPTITYNTFNNNDGYGAYLNNLTITSLPGNTGIGNTYNAIALSGTINTNFVFTNLIDFPYVIRGWLTLNTNNTLTIAEGTVMKFGSGIGLKVYGTLDVNGTSDNNVIFTSLKDDEYGGDTNGDSTATFPYPGDWDGINLYGSGVDNQGIGEFDWCLIRYGGKYLGYARTNVHFNYSTSGHFINSISEYANYSALKTTHCSPDINNSTFRNSNNHGVSCNTYSDTITENTFSDNGNHGLYITGDCTPTITNNTFNNNDGYGAYLNNLTLTSLPGNTGIGNTYNAIALSGTIDTSFEFTNLIDFPYVIHDWITVTANNTLTIAEGTIIKFGSNQGLTVYGTLDLNGTETDPVVFTSLKDDTHGGDTNNDGSATTPAPGNWDGIKLDGYGVDNQGIGEFDWCLIRYGGKYLGYARTNVHFNYSTSGHFINSISEYANYSALKTTHCSPDINNSTFRNSNNHGVSCNTYSDTITENTFSDNGNHGLYITGDCTPTITNNTFNNNDGYGAYLNNLTLTSLPGNTGIGNTYNAIALSGTIDTSFEFTNLIDFPYVIHDWITVTANNTLTIAEGTIIKFGSNQGLTVYGTLDLNGTETDPVVFTSLKDDTHGGDTNNDGSATTPAPGNWDGIKLDGYGVDNQGIGEFDWCLIRYGGKYLGYARTNVHFNYSTSGHFINSISEYANYSALKTTHCSPDINNSTFRNSNNHGVSCNTYSDTITENTFSDNGNHGLYITGDCTPTITNNTFNNNDGYGAYLNNLTLTSLPGNTGIGNTYNAIALSGTIDTSFEFTNLIDFPYVIHDWITVTANNTLTIAEGTIIKFGSNQGLTVYGTLDLNGTETDPVVFTSLKDDTHGGDTNNDGSATTPAPGNWDGIKLDGYGVDNQGIGEFDWCLIRYGGKYLGYARTNVHFNYSTSGHFINSISEYSHDPALKTTDCSPDINNSTFRNSSEGIYCNNSSPIIRGSFIENNADAGIYLTGSNSIPDLGANDPADKGLNTIQNNDDGNFQVYNNTANTINAFYNIWEYTIADSIDAHIYDDDENPAKGEVLFEPWLADVLVAEFSASPTSGNAPLSVNFTDQSIQGTVSIIEWQWDFQNDGTIDSSVQNPTHIYDNPGTYTVSLTVTDENDSTDTEIKTDYITVLGEETSRALQFDGTDDYVYLDDPITGNNPTFDDGFSERTVELWYKATIVEDTQMLYEEGGPINGLNIYIRDSQIWVGAWSETNGFDGIWLSTSTTPDEWHHVSCVFDNQDTHLFKMYYDGNFILDSPISVDISEHINDDAIGAMINHTKLDTGDELGDGFYFSGLVDEVRVWNITRTQAEIQTNMQTYLIGTEDSLVAYYRMNEGIGQTAFDLSGNGNDGQLGSTPNTDVNDPTWIATDWPYVIPLHANFSATPVSGNAPLTVNFTDQSSQGTGAIVEWKWYFGDSDSSSVQNPTHIYDNPGIYTVSLIVTDEHDSTDTEIKTDYITVISITNPTADFVADTTSGYAPLTVNFTDQSTQGTGAIIEWKWYFGDSDSSSVQNPTHIYDNPGIYTVSLTVTDENDSTDTEIKTDYITVISTTNPTANFVADTTSGYAPLTVNFTDQSTQGTGIIVEWKWYFGDGDSSSVQNPTHIYDNPGIYTVSLTVTDENDSTDTEIKTDYITVISTTNPTANFVADTTSGYAPLTVNFTDQSIQGTGAIIEWKWYFGDSDSSSVQSPTHIYQSPGTYTVSLTVTDENDSTDTEIKTDYITVISTTNPTANFVADTTSGYAPLTVNFTDQSIQGTGAIIEWKWYFGDSDSSSVQSPTHIYQSPGTYTVSLTVTDENDSTDTEIKIDYITVDPIPPTANFVADTTSGYAPLTVNFTDQSTQGTGAIIEWKWYFGDGDSSSVQNPTYIYQIPGTYTVSLTVIDEYNSTDTEIKTDYITVISTTNPTANFIAIPTLGNSPLIVNFTDLSIPGTVSIIEWQWDFQNDGTIDSYDQNPTYIYQNPGTYTVSLIVTDEHDSTDTETKIDYITIDPITPTANFVADTTSGYAPLTVNFTDQSTQGTSAIIEWKWYFGDEDSSSVQNPIHIFQNPGIYIVSLTVTDEYDSTDTEIKTDYITVISTTNPTANFVADTTSGYAPLTVNFTDQSIQGIGAIIEWKWYFGDEDSSSVQNPIHIYQSPGTYTVSLTVTDENDSTDTEIKTDYITVISTTNPTADFVATPTSGNAPLTVNFTDLSIPGTVSIIEWQWDFQNDGTIDSYDQNPTYIYQNPGAHTVSLIVTDENDSTDTETKMDYITVSSYEIENCFYPNPYNPESVDDGTFHYTPKTSGNYTITIYDVSNQIVIELNCGSQTANEIFEINWDGKNASGKDIANGTYFYVVKSDSNENYINKFSILR